MRRKEREDAEIMKRNESKRVKERVRQVKGVMERGRNERRWAETKE